MEVSMHSSVIYLFTFSTKTIPSRMVTLGLSARTDHSDVLGWSSPMTWRRDYLFYQSFSTTISMFWEQIQLNGRFSRYPFFFSAHTIYLIYAFSSYITTKYSIRPIMILSSATPSRPIPKLIIPGLKNINYITVTITVFLDLDLFHSLDYDRE